MPLKLVLKSLIVSFSLNDLDKCISATNEYQNFNRNIEEELKKKGPVLRREDFDASKFRRVSTNFHEMHPSRLVKECFKIIISISYK